MRFFESNSQWYMGFEILENFLSWFFLRCRHRLKPRRVCKTIYVNSRLQWNYSYWSFGRSWTILRPGKYILLGKIIFIKTQFQSNQHIWISWFSYSDTSYQISLSLRIKRWNGSHFSMNIIPALVADPNNSPKSHWAPETISCNETGTIAAMSSSWANFLLLVKFPHFLR